MKKSPVKSGARVVEILELFAEERRPLSATEIGAALDYPKSSASLLLHTLVECGWLSLNSESMRYFPHATGERPGRLAARRPVRRRFNGSTGTGTLGGKPGNGDAVDPQRCAHGVCSLAYRHLSDLPEHTGGNACAHVRHSGGYQLICSLILTKESSAFIQRAEAESALTDSSEGTLQITLPRFARRANAAMPWATIACSRTPGLSASAFSRQAQQCSSHGVGGLSSRLPATRNASPGSCCSLPARAKQRCRH